MNIQVRAFSYDFKDSYLPPRSRLDSFTWAACQSCRINCKCLIVFHIVSSLFNYLILDVIDANCKYGRCDPSSCSSIYDRRTGQQIHLVGSTHTSLHSNYFILDKSSIVERVILSTVHIASVVLIMHNLNWYGARIGIYMAPCFFRLLNLKYLNIR